MRSIVSHASARNNIATPGPGHASTRSSKGGQIIGDVPVQLNESQVEPLKKEFGMKTKELTTNQKKFLKI